MLFIMVSHAHSVIKCVWKCVGKATRAKRLVTKQGYLVCKCVLIHIPLCDFFKISLKYFMGTFFTGWLELFSLIVVVICLLGCFVFRFMFSLLWSNERNILIRTLVITWLKQADQISLAQFILLFWSNRWEPISLSLLGLWSLVVIWKGHWGVYGELVYWAKISATGYH